MKKGDVENYNLPFSTVRQLASYFFEKIFLARNGERERRLKMLHTKPVYSHKSQDIVDNVHAWR